MDQEIKDTTAKWLAITVNVAFFGLVALLIFHPVPEGSKEVVFTLAGSMGAGWTGLMSWFFGSSRDSQRKNELLAQSIPYKETATNQPIPNE